MKRTLQRLFVLSVVLLTAVLLIRTFPHVRKGLADQDEEEKEQAIKSPSRLSVENGQAVVTLDPETQSHTGIVVEALKTVTARTETTAPTVVLSAQELVTDRAKRLRGGANCVGEGGGRRTGYAGGIGPLEGTVGGQSKCFSEGSAVR
jgi:hypothetical protein